MKTRLLIIILTLCLNFFPLIAQSAFRVMSYNIENLFDTEDDPGKDDAEFLPNSQRHWTTGRYTNKLNNIARVVAAAGEWDTPAIVGLYEVENEKVMTDLTQRSPLKKQQYRYAMTQSDDARGIDIAFMYQRDRFRYLKHQSYKIKFPSNPGKKTRDILHVSGTVWSGDTLDVFLCHFPSRRAGEAESEPDRIQAASVLRLKVDSVMKRRKNANILLMGDFNDEPTNRSIFETLGAKPYSKNMKPGDLCNLFYHYVKQEKKGSYKYGREWTLIDQMIVSANLMDRTRKFYVLPETAIIFQQDFMMTQDKSNGGKRPKKTYVGMKHEGGYSDHLPLIADFYIFSSEKK